MKPLLLVAALLVASPLSAQRTMFFAEGRVGHNGGLGFKTPSVSVGLHAEKRVLNRLEVQGDFRYSPDNKLSTGDGNAVTYGAQALFIVGPGFALTTGVRQSHLWTSDYNKTRWTPTLGFTVEQGIEGGWLPYGRFYLNYAFPTGCVWGPTCPIQSNRTQGVEVSQEFWLSNRVVVGGKVAGYHFSDQTNPLVWSKRTSHIKAVGGIFVRYRLS